MPPMNKRLLLIAIYQQKTGNMNVPNPLQWSFRNSSYLRQFQIVCKIRIPSTNPVLLDCLLDLTLPYAKKSEV